MWARAALLARSRAQHLPRRLGRRHWSTSTKPAEPAEGASEGTVLGRVTDAVSEKVEAVAEPVLEKVEAATQPLRDIFSLYSHALQEYPLRTNAATAAVLGAAGDAVAQLCEWKLGIMSPDKEGYNYQRTFRMFAFGGLFNGPLLYLWYKTLHSVTSIYRVSYEPLVSGRAGSMFLEWAAERSRLWSSLANLRVKDTVDNTAMSVLAIKVLTDNLLAGPICLHMYFAGIGVLEGLSPSQIAQKTQAAFHRAWGLSTVVWLPMQIINFRYVPLHFQAAFVSLFNAGWRTTLSIMDHYHDYGNMPNRASADILAAQEAELSRLHMAIEALRSENAELRRALATALGGGSRVGAPPELAEGR